jgi:hypothetical protein
MKLCSGMASWPVSKNQYPVIRIHNRLAAAVVIMGGSQLAAMPDFTQISGLMFAIAMNVDKAKTLAFGQ